MDGPTETADGPLHRRHPRALALLRGRAGSGMLVVVAIRRRERRDVYRPLTFGVVVTGNERFMEAVQWYSSLGECNFDRWMMSPEAPGHAVWMPLPPFLIEYPLAPEEPPESPSLSPTNRWSDLPVRRTGGTEAPEE
jgi:hypothetical protein